MHGIHLVATKAYRLPSVVRHASRETPSTTTHADETSYLVAFFYCPTGRVLTPSDAFYTVLYYAEMLRRSIAHVAMPCPLCAQLTPLRLGREKLTTKVDAYGIGHHY